MATKVAFNPETGEMLALIGGQWQAPKFAQNDKGDRLFLGDGGWEPVPGPPKSFGEQATAALGRGLRDTVMGVASLPLMVGDAANATINLGIDALNAVLPKERTLSDLVTGDEGKGAIPRLPRASEAAERFLDRAGLPQAETPSQRVIGRITREAAAMPGNVLTGRALTAAGAPVLSAVGDAFQAAPATQIASGATAGLAGGTTREAFPDSDVADIAASLIGAGAGGVLPLATRQAGVAIKEALTPLTQGGREKIVGDVIRQASRSPETIAAQLDDATPAIISGSRPTTAEATNNAGLAVLQRGVQQSSPQAAAQFAERQAERNVARRDVLSGIEPQSGGAPAVADAVRERLDSVRRSADDIVREATEAADSRIAALGAGADRTTTGGIVRQELQRGYDAALAARDRAAGPLYRAAEQSEAPVNLGAILDNLDLRIEDSAGPIRHALVSVRGDFYLPNGQPKQTARQMDAVRKAINERISKFGAEGLGPEAKRELLQIRDQLDDAVAASIPEYQQARQTFAAHSGAVEPFERGVAGTALERDQFDRRYVRSPETILPDFLNSGKEAQTRAAELTALLGGNGAAMGAVRDFAANELQTFARRPDGTIDATKWRKWLDDRAPALRQFPELYRELGEVGRARALVERVAPMGQRAVDEFEKSAAGYFLKQDPEKAIASVLGAKNAQQGVADLMRTLRGDRDAISGMRRAVKDLALSQAESVAEDASRNRFISVDKFARFLDKNEQALRPLFTPEQMKAIKDVAADLASENYVNTVAKTPGSPTFQNITTGNLISKASLGLINPDNSIWQSTGGRFLGWLYKMPEKQAQELLVDAMLDPKIARALAARATPFTTQRVSEMLRQRAIATGVSAPPLLPEPSPEHRPLMITVRPPEARRAIAP